MHEYKNETYIQQKNLKRFKIIFLVYDLYFNNQNIENCKLIFLIDIFQKNCCIKQSFLKSSKIGVFFSV